jgi:exopolyphosphatase/guanosine-5'-triphosphate,3'-diphosphate pyrophosphatase
VAAFDLGTNSFLCLVADIDESGRLTVIKDLAEIVKLGEGVNQTKVLKKEALERADVCLSRFVSEIAPLGAVVIGATATSAARDAQNAREFLDILNQKKIPVQIISGETEARMTFKGATVGLLSTLGIGVVDVGGGSTEIFQKDINGDEHFVSLDIGGIRLLEMFLKSDPPTEMQINSLRSFARNAVSSLPKMKLKKIIAVGGAPTTLVCLKEESPYSEPLVEGAKLGVSEIDFLVDKMTSLTVSERKNLKGMDPKRADVLPVGAMILSETLKYFETDELTVTAKGVRFGLALDLAGF